MGVSFSIFCILAHFSAKTSKKWESKLFFTGERSLCTQVAERTYTYDNLGNRLNSSEGEKSTTYMTNNLNQYTSVQENSDAAFIPQFDPDGNQTLIKTETGIWSTVYNAENRPVSFSNSEKQHRGGMRVR